MAKRSFDIGKEKERLETEDTSTEEPTLEKTNEAGKQDIETETIIQTDVHGFQKEIQTLGRLMCQTKKLKPICKDCT